MMMVAIVHPSPSNWSQWSRSIPLLRQQLNQPSCFNKNCGTDIEFNSHDSSLYCRGTATIPASIASPTAPANTEAIPTSSPATTPAPTAATASPAPASTSSKPNAGERSVTVSAGGLVAVLAAAVGSLFY